MHRELCRKFACLMNVEEGTYEKGSTVADTVGIMLRKAQVDYRISPVVRGESKEALVVLVVRRVCAESVRV